MKALVVFSYFFYLTCSVAGTPWALGEKDFKEFAPVGDLNFSKENYQGELIFKDSVLNEHYVLNLLQSDFNNLSNFFSWELYNGLACPNDELLQHREYIRFLFRALTLSYIYEDILNLQDEEIKFDHKKTCGFNLTEELKKCSAKTKDMLSFIKNAPLYERKIKSTIPANHDYHKYYSEWIESYKKSNTYSSFKLRVKNYCKTHQCGNLSKALLLNVTTSECKRDKEIFHLICSERDELYGLSSVPQANYLLARSAIVENSENKESLRGCIRRFSSLYQKEERDAKVSQAIYSINYFALKEQSKLKPESLFGRLFPATNLKIFEDKGVATVLKVENNKKKEVKVAEAPGPKIELAPPPLPVVKNEAPPKVVALKKEPKKAPPPPKKELSTFLTAANFLGNYKLSIIKLDMNKFYYDFIFTPSMLDSLSKSVKQFVSLDAIKEMKKFDHLGEKESALPLLFIKYMIDQEMHKGLFNIVTVLGNKFYVLNDLDGKENLRPYYIELKNDESTKYTWQIFILKDPSTN